MRLQELELDYGIKLPKKTDYGIGVIGCGGIMNGAHLPAYQKLGFKVVACADIREEAVKQTQEKWQIPKGFTDHRKLLELPEVEIVDIAIQREGRVEIVRDCAKAGKHILIQKPFSHSLKDAEAMVKACEKAGVKIMVNQQARYAPGHRLAKLLVEKGVIGRIFHLTHHIRGNQDSGWPAETPNFVIIDHGIHYIDLMRYWSGKEPVRVLASTIKMPGQKAIAPMVYSINLEFDDNLMANLWFNDVVQGRDGHYEFIIDGTEGVIRGDATTVTVIPKDSTINSLTLKLKGQWFPDAFGGTMAELMRAIQENDEPAVSGRDNLKTLRIGLAAVESSQTHRTVELRWENTKKPLNPARRGRRLVSS